MQNWKDLKKELLNDKDVKEKYEELKPRYEFVLKLIQLREKRKLTQKQLAEKLNTKQSAISRLESGNTNVSIAFLEKIAKALDSEVYINFK